MFRTEREPTLYISIFPAGGGVKPANFRYLTRKTKSTKYPQEQVLHRSRISTNLLEYSGITLYFYIQRHVCTKRFSSAFFKKSQSPGLRLWAADLDFSKFMYNVMYVTQCRRPLSQSRQRTRGNSRQFYRILGKSPRVVVQHASVEGVLISICFIFFRLNILRTAALVFIVV